MSYSPFHFFEAYCEGQVYERYNEQNLADGKRDHSAEELFANELKLPVHKLPVKELRRYHLARRHLPSKLKNNSDLATTLTAHRNAEDKRFRNTWLLIPP